MMRRFFILMALCPLMLMAQDFPDLSMMSVPDSLNIDKRVANLPDIPTLNMADIPGAPVLSQPFRIDGSEFEIRTEEHGLAYPTIFDWNRDGRPDLLMGEFLTGPSRIKVYLNVGTAEKPKFSGRWFYATDVNGDTIANSQWCCIGIHPQIVDLNSDGYDDIVSGQYYPGVITWWQGSEKGFLPGKEIPQQGYQTGKEYSMGIEPAWSEEAWEYWNYSSGRVADFNGDGLLDLFVAGNGGYRVALNVGSKDEPRFGRREFLFQTDGKILHTNRLPNVTIASGKPFNPVSACSGNTIHTYLNPVDWDGDGVLDIISTDEFVSPEQAGVYFFRGVMTDDGLRFENAVPLFASAVGTKALPGCAPHIQIVDYNGDGIKDIVLGLSIPTVFGFEGAKDIYFKWVKEMGINSPGKDSGESLHYYGTTDDLKARIKNEPYMKDYLIGKLDDWKYLTLRHRGYPFVFLGSAPKDHATATEVKAAPREFLYDVGIQDYNPADMNQNPISVTHFFKKDSDSGEWISKITFRTRGTYHLYTQSAMNMNRPVKIEYTLPEGVELAGEMKTPPTLLAGGSEIYDGKILIFSQRLKNTGNLPKGDYPAKVKISWQSCCDESCLPPEELEEDFEIEIL